VIDSRADTHLGVSTIRRRRGCSDCDFRWTTFELSEDSVAKMQGMDKDKKRAAILWVIDALRDKLEAQAREERP
jgi:transcriptional regulator NrdR family protein